MKRRTFWQTPILLAVTLPAHAQTSCSVLGTIPCDPLPYVPPDQDDSDQIIPPQPDSQPDFNNGRN